MERVQRERVKGWRKPPNTKIVDRTSRWGNPIKVENGKIFISIKQREPKVKWKYYKEGNIEDVIEIYRSLWTQDNFEDADLQYWANKIKELDLKELQGKDLACFCSLESPCHADVLIERSYENN